MESATVFGFEAFWGGLVWLILVFSGAAGGSYLSEDLRCCGLGLGSGRAPPRQTLQISYEQIWWARCSFFFSSLILWRWWGASCRGPNYTNMPNLFLESSPCRLFFSWWRHRRVRGSRLGLRSPQTCPVSRWKGAGIGGRMWIEECRHLLSFVCFGLGWCPYWQYRLRRNPTPKLNQQVSFSTIASCRCRPPSNYHYSRAKMKYGSSAITANWSRHNDYLAA